MVKDQTFPDFFATFPVAMILLMRRHDQTNKYKDKGKDRELRKSLKSDDTIRLGKNKKRPLLDYFSDSENCQYPKINLIKRFSNNSTKSTSF